MNEQYEPTPEQQREWIEQALKNSGFDNTIDNVWRKQFDKGVDSVVEFTSNEGTAYSIYLFSEGAEKIEAPDDNVNNITKLIEDAMTGAVPTTAIEPAPKKQKPQLPAKQELIHNNIVPQDHGQLTVDDIKKYINPKATEQEAIMFLQLCKARGLNPWIGEVYLIKYQNNEAARTVVGKDAMLRKAQDNKNYNGFKAGIIVEKDHNQEYQVVEEKDGAFLAKGETLIGGWAEVYRKDCDYPFVSKVSFEEYASKKFDGTLNKMWATKPATMIRKVAIVQAHREAYTKELSGMYDESEM